MSNAGFIGAACGQLDAVLQRTSNVDNSSLSKGVGSDVSAVKTHRNRTATKPAYRTEYVYGNCNGLHF